MTKTEMVLRESEERFRPVLDNSRDVVYRLNLRTGKFEYMSPSAQEATGFSSDDLSRIDKAAVGKLVHPDGYTRAELPAISPLDVLTEESGKIFEERITKYLSGEKLADSILWRKR